MQPSAISVHPPQILLHPPDGGSSTALTGFDDRPVITVTILTCLSAKGNVLLTFELPAALSNDVLLTDKAKSFAEGYVKHLITGNRDPDEEAKTEAARLKELFARGDTKAADREWRSLFLTRAKATAVAYSQVPSEWAVQPKFASEEATTAWALAARRTPIIE